MEVNTKKPLKTVPSVLYEGLIINLQCAFSQELSVPFITWVSRDGPLFLGPKSCFYVHICQRSRGVKTNAILVKDWLKYGEQQVKNETVQVQVTQLYYKLFSLFFPLWALFIALLFSADRSPAFSLRFLLPADSNRAYPSTHLSEHTLLSLFLCHLIYTVLSTSTVLTVFFSQLLNLNHHLLNLRIIGYKGGKWVKLEVFTLPCQTPDLFFFPKVTIHRQKYYSLKYILRDNEFFFNSVKITNPAFFFFCEGGVIVELFLI